MHERVRARVSSRASLQLRATHPGAVRPAEATVNEATVNEMIVLSARAGKEPSESRPGYPWEVSVRDCPGIVSARLRSTYRLIRHSERLADSTECTALGRWPTGRQ